MATHLLDKSAWVRLDHPEVFDRWSAPLLAGKVAVTGVGMLEVLVSALSATDFDDTRADLNTMPLVAVTEQTYRPRVWPQAPLLQASSRSFAHWLGQRT